MPAARTLGDFAMWLDLPSARYPPLGDTAKIEKYIEAKFKCWASLLCARVAHQLLLTSAGSSLTYSLCGQNVIQRISARSLSSSVRQG